MWFALYLKYRDRRKRDPLPALPDEEVLLRYRKHGDPVWMGILYDRYVHLVYGVCLKYLKNRENARDAAMDIFEKMMEDLRKHEIRHFRSWLHTVSRNHCLMILRSKKQSVDIEEGKGILFMENEEEMHLSIAEEKEKDLVRLEQAIGLLKQEQQECIRLVYLENRTYYEVCELTGYTVNQVKSHVQNGKRNLKILLEKNA